MGLGFSFIWANDSCALTPRVDVYGEQSQIASVSYFMKFLSSQFYGFGAGNTMGKGEC